MMEWTGGAVEEWPTDSRPPRIDLISNPPGSGVPGGPGNIFRREVDRDQHDRGFQLCGFSSRIE